MLMLMLYLYINFSWDEELQILIKNSVANIIDTLTDQIVTGNWRATSGQASYFYCHQESNKNFTVSLEKPAAILIGLSQETESIQL